jgi:hypothetical protein
MQNQSVRRLCQRRRPSHDGLELLADDLVNPETVAYNGVDAPCGAMDEGTLQHLE